MDLTVSLLKYRRTLGKASAILNTDAVGIGWERQYAVWSTVSDSPIKIDRV